jgi:hypothetical protein
MSSQAGEPAHALLSASSSHRWLSCPPSARLSQNYEDRESDYAAEGTAAHLLCEYKLKIALGLEAEDPTPDLSHHDQEMEECADGYAAYVLELVEAANETCVNPIVLIEQRLDYSRYAEGGFGTGDCVIAHRTHSTSIMKAMFLYLRMLRPSISFHPFHSLPSRAACKA